MNDSSAHKAQLEAEAEALFELLRARPGEEDVISLLTEWVARSEDHRAVYDAVAVGWISTLIKQAANAPDTESGHGTTFH